MWIDASREVMETNVYDIPQRLKELDPGYFVARNHMTRRFEVHHKDNIGGTYSCTIPYDELDSRAIDYVRWTSAANRDKIFAELDRQNELIDRERERKFTDGMDELSKEIHRYAAPKADEVRFLNNGG